METKSDSAVPTIADVARRAGVSTATVSRCLNDPSKVQPATREKVQEAVRALGYTPNFGARALVAKRTNTVGAVIPTMDNAIFARGLQAFQEALHEQGVTLLVASAQYQPDFEEEQIRTLLARGADGLLLIGYERGPEIYAELQRRGVATVVAWAFDPNSPLTSVGFDNRKAMKALAGAVVARGHRHIGVISAVTASNDRARDRVSGIKEVLAEEGLPVSNLRIIETNYAIESGRYAAAELLSHTPRPTAIMCGNDVLAAGAIREVRRMGYRVPEDISVTGFDDIELAEICEPPLTTVHVPHRQMGHRAALALLQMIREGQAAPSIELKTELRVRDSLGPCPTS
ncbi:MAG: LacI family DNA-binding transcriptional regulator [Rhodobacteraceae bacterium]|nr:LacI family DNA-binding transcriptional regulator [Paracoccaceae bacterium]